MKTADSIKSCGRLVGAQVIPANFLQAGGKVSGAVALRRGLPLQRGSVIVRASLFQCVLVVASLSEGAGEVESAGDSAEKVGLGVARRRRRV